MNILVEISQNSYHITAIIAQLGTLCINFINICAQILRMSRMRSYFGATFSQAFFCLAHKVGEIAPRVNVTVII
jgi:hypothetical protein